MRDAANARGDEGGREGWAGRTGGDGFPDAWRKETEHQSKERRSEKRKDAFIAQLVRACG